MVGAVITGENLTQVVALGAAVVVLAAVRHWAMHRIALRPRPVVSADVAAADDEVRRMASSAGISRPMITLAALAVYYLSLGVLIVMVAGAFGIVRSRHGRAFQAVRDDDVAAGMMGINVTAAKSRAFLVGAFYAGIAGGLFDVGASEMSALSIPSKLG